MYIAMHQVLDNLSRAGMIVEANIVLNLYLQYQ